MRFGCSPFRRGSPAAGEGGTYHAGSFFIQAGMGNTKAPSVTPVSMAMSEASISIGRENLRKSRAETYPSASMRVAAVGGEEKGNMIRYWVGGTGLKT